jgi:hypothetical protein
MLTSKLVYAKRGYPSVCEKKQSICEYKNCEKVNCDSQEIFHFLIRDFF